MSAPENAAPVFIVSGTRPEIIKLAPVHAALRQALGEDRVAWIATGQHRELADTVLDSFARYDVASLCLVDRVTHEPRGLIARSRVMSRYQHALEHS